MITDVLLCAGKCSILTLVPRCLLCATELVYIVAKARLFGLQGGAAERFVVDDLCNRVPLGALRRSRHGLKLRAVIGVGSLTEAPSCITLVR